MSIRCSLPPLLLTALLCGCHGHVSIGDDKEVSTVPGATVTRAIPPGRARLHVHEVENSATGIEYKWTLDGTGADAGSNTSTTGSSGEKPISLLVAPAGSQVFHCEVSVRAENAENNNTRISERTVIVLGNDTRTQSGDWTEPGAAATNLRLMQKADVDWELPRQVVLATIHGKPVSIRMGE